VLSHAKQDNNYLRHVAFLHLWRPAGSCPRVMTAMRRKVHNERYKEDHQEDVKQNLSDRRGSCGDAPKAQNARNDRND
jgi:hypothetical protein